MKNVSELASAIDTVAKCFREYEKLANELSAAQLAISQLTALCRMSSDEHTRAKVEEIRTAHLLKVSRLRKE